MGRKSRLKKERKSQACNRADDITFKAVNDSNPNPQSVYRFFEEEWQADALCRGDVWISTLETCRKYEDALQGDPYEAMHTYRSGAVSGNGTDPGFVEVARRSGIYIAPSVRNFSISGVTIVHSIPDAYVLCTTKEFNPEILSDTFGGYCVQIFNLPIFFERITTAINKKVCLERGSYADVKYRSRDFTGLNPPPGRLGFVKKIDGYSTQKEFRFLWEPKITDNLEPFLVTCPSVAELCKRII